MTCDSIRVDLFNPGQVFACIGFLEVADTLLGDAEGGFDWTDDTNERFLLRAAGNNNPFAVVIDFLSRADLLCVAPVGYTNPSPKTKGLTTQGGCENRIPSSKAPPELEFSDTFPASAANRMTLPLRLQDSHARSFDLTHWTDGSSRNEFKLYAGNRSAYSIAWAMLRGTPKTLGVKDLSKKKTEESVRSPFGVVTPMGGSFNFDARGAWTALDAGYSPNQHTHHGVAASPIVEFLAACGLEHARPEEHETRCVRYAIWSGLVPPILARPLLGGARVCIPTRKFRFILDLSGKNKVVTFAQEETSV